MKRGYSIKIFLPDGEPDGLKLVEKTNWSGLGVVCPRSLFGEKKSRQEFERTGVYLLVGEGDGVSPEIYIGEADELRSRLSSHFKESKLDWDYVVFFVSKDNSLNKAHVRYLEWRLIELAKGANRAQIANANAGSKPSLSEADVTEAEGFLDEIRQCFPIIQLDVFETPRKSISKKTTINLFALLKGLTASGYQDRGEFIVVKGSHVSPTEAPTTPPGMRQRRIALMKSGVLADVNGNLVFTQDFAFPSPSTAAAVVLGRSANGRIEWVDKNGKTLREIQELQERTA